MLSRNAKMRDLCNKTAQELQLLIKEVKVTKFWSKAAQKDADNLFIGLKDEVSDLQTALLNKKSKDFEKAQRSLLEICSQSEGCADTYERVQGSLAQDIFQS